jgi:hypothetical protein
MLRNLKFLLKLHFNFKNPKIENHQPHQQLHRKPNEQKDEQKNQKEQKQQHETLYQQPSNFLYWFNKELFNKIFPYSKASVVYTHDNEPFWTFEDFIESIKWLNNHKNIDFHNFANSGDLTTDKQEMAMYLANTMQETGDPSLSAPYPWDPRSKNATPKVTDGSCGGLTAIMEGLQASVQLGQVSDPRFVIKGCYRLNDIEKQVLNTTEDFINGGCYTLDNVNQRQFGLGMGTGNGAVMQNNYAAVSDKGILYGAEENEKYNIKKYTGGDINNPMFASTKAFSQYGGRGGIQLSYNYNYTDCSLDLFDDYRLVKYPNLITTTDRNNFLGIPQVFGFPGENENGNNKLPFDVSSTTPSARQMAYITSLWFWMIPRSGRSVSCHYCAKKYKTYGITSVNMIVNNQSGEDYDAPKPSWAGKKCQFYIRICKILDIEPIIVRPVNKNVII